MKVLHGLVDRIDLPEGPPRHTQLATQSLDHLIMVRWCGGGKWEGDSSQIKRTISVGWLFVQEFCSGGRC